MEEGKGGRREGKKEGRKEAMHNAAKTSEANGSQGYATRSSTHSGHGTAQKRYFYEAYVEVAFQRFNALSAIQVDQSLNCLLPQKTSSAENVDLAEEHGKAHRALYILHHVCVLVMVARSGMVATDPGAH